MARALRRILGALTSLTQGLTELRNQVGTGHGRESVPAWVRQRHASPPAPRTRGVRSCWRRSRIRMAPWRSDTST
jgi:hypothetical protein